MFKISYDNKKHCYELIAENTGDEFRVSKISKCSTYPKSAKRPYKGYVVLIKDNKNIKLNMADPSARLLYGAIMDSLCVFIQWQKDNQLLKQKECSLVSQNLDDTIY